MTHTVDPWDPLGEERPPTFREANTELSDERTDTAPGANRSIVVYVRSTMGNTERVRTVLGTLEALAERGVFSTVDVRMWPAKVSLQPDGPWADLVRRFDAFQEWADDNGVSIQPPFTVRHHDATIIQEHDDVLVTPIMFLAVYEDDDLIGVYPCHRDNRSTTITEYLDQHRQDDQPDSQPPDEDDPLKGRPIGHHQ